LPLLASLFGHIAPELSAPFARLFSRFATLTERATRRTRRCGRFALRRLAAVGGRQFDSACDACGVRRALG
jgi:hypothetical protein